MLDEEMKELINESLEVDIDHLYISSVAQQGIAELKDKLYSMITAHK
jgi:GTP-binding protein